MTLPLWLVVYLLYTCRRSLSLEVITSIGRNLHSRLVSTPMTETPQRTAFWGWVGGVVTSWLQLAMSSTPALNYVLLVVNSIMTLILTPLLRVIAMLLLFFYLRLHGRSYRLRVRHCLRGLLLSTRWLPSFPVVWPLLVCLKSITVCRILIMMGQPNQGSQVLPITLVTLCLVCMWEPITSIWRLILLLFKPLFSNQKLRSLRNVFYEKLNVKDGRSGTRRIVTLIPFMCYLMVSTLLWIITLWQRIYVQSWSMMLDLVSMIMKTFIPHPISVSYLRRN
uniref:Uncharacterized protein n=1 Tax=Riboviria sp. TaxID=2585031 RepID=A0A8K1WRJ4_9VIRU|nr:MAG: hypothetical protein 3 [Riboviria sp.]